jgi:hypothetical protein
VVEARAETHAPHRRSRLTRVGGSPRRALAGYVDYLAGILGFPDAEVVPDIFAEFVKLGKTNDIINLLNRRSTDGPYRAGSPAWIP